MVTTLSSKIASYFESLEATSTVCSVLGSTLTFGTNLFINYEPEVSSCVSVIQYSGEPPAPDGNKYNSSFQVRVKNSSRATGEQVSQAVINLFHQNGKIVPHGLVTANNSAPLLLYVRSGGEEAVFVSNFTVKYIKL
jgi:hypothetical protein